jgi:lysophospholipase L1-like esterase
MDAAPLTPPYDLVSLLIGVNNQYRGRPLDEYRVEFTALLERAIGLAGKRAGRVLVVSIPDWGITPFARASGRDRAEIARELDAFNAAARQICAAHGVAFADITPESRAHGSEAGMLVGDGLHPSGAMYFRWSEIALPVVAGMLRP